MALGLVVDANVISSAGAGASGPSWHCRVFLEAITAADMLHLVRNRKILQEWTAINARFGLRFLTTMQSTGRIVDLETTDEEAALLAGMERCSLTKAQQRRLKNDLHLLTAALQSDKRIASQDEEARGCARKLATADSEVGNVLWLNPALPAERPLEWLAQGAPLDSQRLLGHDARSQQQSS